MKSTIIDVAKAARVSVATVSRVVNGNYPVKEETRRRVQEVIEKLQYVPNIQARELNTQRSMMIGVVVPSLYNMFFAEVIDGIEEYLSGDSYSLLLCCAKNDPKLEARCINDLMQRNVSGIIIVSPNTKDLETDFYDRIARNQALVFINSRVKRPNISYVSNDEYRGSEIALEHLLEYGHRKILFIRGKNSDSHQVKEDAYTDVMKRRGIFDASMILNIGEGNRYETVDNTMYRLMDMILDLDATAIFACNDLMAVGAVNACKRMQKRIPADMSIIGFDNTPLSHFIEPKLTTMDQNMYALGAAAARILTEKISGAASPSKNIVLNNTLIERETTGPCLK